MPVFRPGGGWGWGGVFSQTVMLLSLILTDKERRQLDGSGGEGDTVLNESSAPPIKSSETERDAQGCCRQQQTPLLSDAVAQLDEHDEVTGKAGDRGPIYPVEGTGSGSSLPPGGDSNGVCSGERGEENSKRFPNKGPELAATKRRRLEESKRGASSGGNFAGVGGRAAMVLRAGVQPGECHDIKGAEGGRSAGRRPALDTRSSRVAVSIVGLVGDIGGVGGSVNVRSQEVRLPYEKRGGKDGGWFCVKSWFGSCASLPRVP